MTDTPVQPAETVKVTEVSAIRKVLNALAFMKSIDEASLRDVETIASVVDDHKEPHMMPTAKEVPTGSPQAMRGGQAPTQVEAHSNILPQEGMTRMYDEFNNRMAAMQKSIATVASTVSTLVTNLNAAVKAEKDSLDKTVEERDSAEEMAKKAVAAQKAKADALATIFRKARVAVRKASEDDDEDKDEMEDKMEKAKTALSALNDFISKAEEADDMDDEDEKRAEKARTDYRALKTALKKAVEARVKKAAPVVTASATQATSLAPVITKDDLSAALDSWAASKGITVPALFEQMGVKSSTIEPPIFAKAIASKELTPEILSIRIEDAADNGLLRDGEIAKADSLRARFAGVRAGKYDAVALANEINLATPAVQSLFMTA